MNVQIVTACSVIYIVSASIARRIIDAYLGFLLALLRETTPPPANNKEQQKRNNAHHFLLRLNKNDNNWAQCAVHNISRTFSRQHVGGECSYGRRNWPFFGCTFRPALADWAGHTFPCCPPSAHNCCRVEKGDMSVHDRHGLAVCQRLYTTNHSRSRGTRRNQPVSKTDCKWPLRRNRQSSLCRRHCLLVVGIVFFSREKKISHNHTRRGKVEKSFGVCCDNQLFCQHYGSQGVIGGHFVRGWQVAVACLPPKRFKCTPIGPPFGVTPHRGGNDQN